MNRQPMLRMTVVAATLVAALMSACDGGSGPGVATAQGVPASPATPWTDPFVRFTQCLRDHGVDAADPAPGAPFELPDEPEQKSALDACKDLLPEQVNVKGHPSQRQLEQLVAYARCLRDHGIDATDPDPTNGGIALPAGTKGTASLAAAEEACREFLGQAYGGKK